MSDGRPTRAAAAPFRLVEALATVSALAAIATLPVPDLLTGPPAMNGHAKGTALVVLLAGVPVLLADIRG